jgi:hypothetical protein
MVLFSNDEAIYRSFPVERAYMNSRDITVFFLIEIQSLKKYNQSFVSLSTEAEFREK